MKRLKIAVFIYFLALSLLPGFLIAQEEIAADSPPTEEVVAATEQAPQEVIVYLDGGEMIKGELVERREDGIILEKQGNRLTFKKDSIEKVVDSKTKTVLPGFIKAPFKTAVITYEVKGGGKTAKPILYIDVGKNMFWEDNPYQFGLMGGLHGVGSRFFDGKKLYLSIGSPQEEGIVKDAPAGASLFDMLDTGLFEFGDIFSNIEKPSGNDEEFLGRKCKVYKSSLSKKYVWSGITLKEETGMGEYLTIKQAVDIKLDVPIPPEKMKLLEGAKFKTWEEMQKEMFKGAGELPREYQKGEEEALKKMAETDPELKKILEQSTNEDGTLDFDKINQLKESVWQAHQEKQEQKIIEEAKGISGGEELIKECTGKDGKIDAFKLQQLFYKKQTEIRNKQHALSAKARALENKQMYKEAIENYSEAISFGKADSWLYRSRYRLYCLLGQFDNALRDLSLAMEKEKYGLVYADGVPYDYNRKDRAELLLFLKKYQEALDDCDKAIIEIKEAYSKQQEESKSNIPEEMYYYTKITEENLANGIAQVLCLRGKIYLYMGKLEEALRDADEALAKSSVDNIKADAYFLRGLVYKALDEPQKMQDDFFEADKLGNKLADYLQVASMRQGQYVRYHKNGEKECEGNYVNGRDDGIFRWYYTTGQIKSEIPMKNGKRHGEAKFYGGFKEIKSVENYQDGKREGESKYYFDNGALKEEGVWHDDLENGPHAWYYPNGNPKEKDDFRNGKIHGMHYYYYESGQLKEEGPYKDGKEHGEMTLYSEDGSLKKKIIFEHGKRVKEIFPGT
ncbi:MAG: hypothetical protein KJ880_04380 [Candidatus Omnitrophica bacterium]|nr:hypothetical protein [Candidatus Omnitrophota bacterium]MBU1869832.1 hypothetical protein [Candidatus Omnitrophota bacterium]